MEQPESLALLQHIGFGMLKMLLVATPALLLIALIDRALNFMPWSITFRAGHLLAPSGKRPRGKHNH